MNSENRVNLADTRPLTNENGIDLVGLFAVLWQSKWLLIGVTSAISIAAFFFIQSMEPIYEVEATLNSTSEYDVQALRPSILTGGEVYQLAPLSTDSIYTAALAYAASLHVKSKFWLERTGEPLTPRTPGAVLTPNDLAFQAFADGLQIVRGDPNSNAPGLSRAVLESPDPAEGVLILNDYIKYVDRYTVSQFVHQLRTGYESTHARLVEDYQVLYKREKISLEDELIRLREAYQLAESLGIRETPYEQVQNVELSIMDKRLYLLGTNVLAEEINALRARQDVPLEAFVPQLRKMEHWRNQIEGDLRKLDVANDSVHAFVVVAPPESSLDPVKPNKILLFLAAIFGAGMLGVIIVFFRVGFDLYRARQGEISSYE